MSFVSSEGDEAKVMKRFLKAMILIAFTGSMLFTGACATSFTGSAFVDEGRSGCEAKCKGQGMELAGMVYMGEYSDACVCTVPGRSASASKHLLASAGAVAGGSAGVVMQMRRNEQQAQHRH
jgi:hypothetical protein